MTWVYRVAVLDLCIPHMIDSYTFVLVLCIFSKDSHTFSSLFAFKDNHPRERESVNACVSLFHSMKGFIAS